MSRKRIARPDEWNDYFGDRVRRDRVAETRSIISSDATHLGARPVGTTSWTTETHGLLSAQTTLRTSWSAPVSQVPSWSAQVNQVPSWSNKTGGIRLKTEEVEEVTVKENSPIIDATGGSQTTVREARTYESDASAEGNDHVEDNDSIEEDDSSEQEETIEQDNWVVEREATQEADIAERLRTSTIYERFDSVLHTTTPHSSEHISSLKRDEDLYSGTLLAGNSHQGLQAGMMPTTRSPPAVEASKPQETSRTTNIAPMREVERTPGPEAPFQALKPLSNTRRADPVWPDPAPYPALVSLESGIPPRGPEQNIQSLNPYTSNAWLENPRRRLLATKENSESSATHIVDIDHYARMPSPASMSVKYRSDDMEAHVRRPGIIKRIFRRLLCR